MYASILVPYDGSRASVHALQAACRLARIGGGTVHVAHVVQVQGGGSGFEDYGLASSDFLADAQRSGAALLDQAREHAGVAGCSRCETELLSCQGCHLAQCIAEHAAQIGAELLVIASHGRRDAARLFLGSDAAHILSLCPVPVLLIREPDSSPPRRSPP